MNERTSLGEQCICCWPTVQRTLKSSKCPDIFNLAWKAWWINTDTILGVERRLGILGRRELQSKAKLIMQQLPSHEVLGQAQDWYPEFRLAW